MNGYVQDFIDSIESKNSQKVMKYVFKIIDAIILKIVIKTIGFVYRQKPESQLRFYWLSGSSKV